MHAVVPILLFMKKIKIHRFEMTIKLYEITKLLFGIHVFHCDAIKKNLNAFIKFLLYKKGTYFVTFVLNLHLIENRLSLRTFYSLFICCYLLHQYLLIDSLEKSRDVLIKYLNICLSNKETFR